MASEVPSRLVAVGVDDSQIHAVPITAAFNRRYDGIRLTLNIE